VTVRIGLLGGTFDPPHLGHLVVAECARVALDLDEVRLVVAGDPWMKGSAPSPPEVRLALVEAAVAGDPHVRADARELARSGPTYTADTLAELAAESVGAELFFLLGEDAAADLPSWERIDEAFARATFVVVTRPGQHAPAPEELPGAVVHLEVPQLEVSSTELRERYRTGDATRYLVPDAVDRLVRERGLYGAGPAP